MWKSKKKQCTAVLGGLTSLGSKDVAETWVYDKLFMLYGPKPKFVESRGDFRGILFAQFDSVEDPRRLRSCEGASQPIAEAPQTFPVADSERRFHVNLHIHQFHLSDCQRHICLIRLNCRFRIP